MSLSRLDVFYFIENTGDEYAKERPGSLNVSRLIRGYPARFRCDFGVRYRQIKINYNFSLTYKGNLYVSDKDSQR